MLSSAPPCSLSAPATLVRCKNICLSHRDNCRRRFAGPSSSIYARARAGASPGQARARLGSKAERRNKTERRNRNPKTQQACADRLWVAVEVEVSTGGRRSKRASSAWRMCKWLDGAGQTKATGSRGSSKGCSKIVGVWHSWAAIASESLPKCSKKENKLLISRSPQSPYALQETGLNDRMATQHAAWLLASGFGSVYSGGSHKFRCRCSCSLSEMKRGTRWSTRLGGLCCCRCGVLGSTLKLSTHIDVDCCLFGFAFCHGLGYVSPDAMWWGCCCCLHYPPPPLFRRRTGGDDRCGR